ncbi:acriflavin resistance protein [Rhodanobacter sp. FW510-R12]|uniref:efflux RND transporter permease subunit n=1 Tax=unclassified Rhodanobacter TaxID=2621553 RepID=UPI0007AA4552|nr:MULTISPECIES: efflux RND transporter permease subunit [unclassified Rhodanobacter]KZC17818.1 acriflavin resistance protein [Rhodanobacter sp. FW104-R8]KZC27178.1 acriflavin resistance protein [Rhodanobacter sp. FW510-T8]KZC31616.1 acriflavin resistance protein [Rhodanobacter sp. FW510-R10]
MNIFAPLIRRPVGTSLLALGLILAGLWAYLLLGVAALPSLDFPGVYVAANQPGASAQTMANTILAPLERHLGRIPGVDEMYGNASEGSASVMVRFTMSRTADSAARDVQAAINAAAVDLPSGMPTPPQYFKFDTSQIPILFLTLTSTGLPQDQLFDLADTMLKPAVAQIGGVAQVQVFGGTPHSVRIELDNNALAAKGLTTNDVANALRAANVTSPQGTLSNGRTQMTVSASDGLQTPAEFARLLISVKNGTPVRLSDVARVYGGQQDEYQAAWFNGARTVGLQISKRPEANAVATVEAIRARLPQLGASLPSNVTMSAVFDLTQTTKSALHEVQVALLISIAMVVLVMLVFLRRLRPTLIATLSVPLSLAGAFVVMWALGYTLNTLSLVALVLCIGFVVDDAIVVIENIVRHMERGEPPMQAALTGVREIGFTVISITLSLVAVFAPLLFGNNMLVMLLREFSVTLAAAVVISALVSLTLTPALCAYLLEHEPAIRKPPGRLERAVENFDRRLLRIYERALDWAMHHRRIMRWQPLTLLLLTFALGFAVAKTAGGTFMPQEDTGQLQVDIRADANISPDRLAERVQHVAALMQADPTVLDLLTMLGRNGGGDGAVGNAAQMFVDLKPRGSGPEQRHENIKQVIERLSKQFDRLPDVKVSVSPVQFLGGGGSGDGGGQYEFQLVSSNGGDLQPWTLKMVRQMRTIKQFRDVSSGFDQVGKQQLLKIDREAAGRLHVGIGTIDSALYNAFGQRQVSQIYSDINQYAVVLSTGAAQSVSAESLLNVRVRNEQGRMIPLSALAKIEPNISPLRVRHHNQLEAATISYNLAKDVPQDLGVKLVEQAAYAVGLPAGMRVDFTGANQRLKQAQSNGMVLLLGSILAMYIVLGILYESLGHPLTILSTLPAAGAGAFLAMLVTQTQISMMAIIAILMLIGIVKKNAILMVDFALVAERERGLPAPEAIREAALVRFRPITMTTLVAMGAALPLAIGFGIGSEMRQPLGIAIVGGLLVSQLLTLLSTPAIYLWNHDRKIRKAARKERRAEKKRLKALGKPQTA